MMSILIAVGLLALVCVSGVLWVFTMGLVSRLEQRVLRLDAQLRDQREVNHMVIGVLDLLLTPRPHTIAPGSTVALIAALRARIGAVSDRIQ